MLKRTAPSSSKLDCDCKNSNKKPKTHDIIYTGPAVGYPPGWKLVEKKRLNGKCVGSIDRWWYSPQTGKRFRSVVETKKFLACLKLTNNDEDEAMHMFKQQKSKDKK